MRRSARGERERNSLRRSVHRDGRGYPIARRPGNRAYPHRFLHDPGCLGNAKAGDVRSQCDAEGHGVAADAIEHNGRGHIAVGRHLHAPRLGNLPDSGKQRGGMGRGKELLRIGAAAIVTAKRRRIDISTFNRPSLLEAKPDRPPKAVAAARYAWLMFGFPVWSATVRALGGVPGGRTTHLRSREAGNNGQHATTLMPISAQYLPDRMMAKRRPRR